jgi:hypothetical protein
MLILTMRKGDGDLLEILEIDNLKHAIEIIKNNVINGVRSFEVNSITSTYKGFINENFPPHNVEAICLRKM